MKLCVFLIEGKSRLGAVTTHGIVDLSMGYTALLSSQGEAHPYEMASAAIPSEIIAFLERGEAAMDAARKVVEVAQERDGEFRGPCGEALVHRLEGVKLASPIPRPRKFVAIGGNYHDLIKAAGLPVPARPDMFAKFPSSVISPGEPIVLPNNSTQVIYEAELAFVIGTGGKHIPQERAYEHIAGYTIFNDVTARDWQLEDKGIGIRMKSADTFSPLGPYLVTRDEIPDPQTLSIRLSMDGQVLQDSSTKQMIFPVSYLVSYLSDIFTFEPGDLVATGTPAGSSWMHDPPAYLHPGAEIVIEIEGVGTLTNPVVAE